MADPDSSWMLDDDAPMDFSNVGGDEAGGGDDESQDAPDQAAPVEVPKPPAEWRKTYKLAVSIRMFYTTGVFVFSLFFFLSFTISDK